MPPVSRHRKKKKKTGNSPQVYSKPDTKKKPELDFVDVERITFQKFLESNSIDFNELFNRTCSDILNKAQNKFAKNQLNQGDELLIEYLSQAESLLSGILKKYNTYEFIYWARRLPPVNSFNVSELSIHLYRHIFDLAVHKYCNNEIDSQQLVTGKDEFGEFGISNPFKIKTLEDIEAPLDQKIKELLSDVILCEFICSLFLRATQGIRTINKGGEFKLSPKTNLGYFIDTPEDVSFLINLYDDRIKKNNLFSLVGGYVNSNASEQDIPLLLFYVNVNNKLRLPLINYEYKEFRDFRENRDVLKYIYPNFALYPFDGGPILDYLQDYEVEFKELYHFTIYDFVVFLGYLSHRLIINFKNSVNGQYSILQTGYYVSSNYSGLIQVLKEYSVALFKNRFNINIKPEDYPAEQIIKTFLLNNSNKKDLNLWTRGPSKIFYRLKEDFFIIDLANVNEIISFITKDLARLDDKIGNRRALAFEESVANEIKKQFGNSKLWVARRRIYNQMGQSREIDSSIIIRDILFIIEAKSKNVSFGFDKGDRKSIDFRNKEFVKALQEVENKVNFLIDNSSYLSCLLPTKIKHIVPLVISPHAEYIWDKDKNLFLDSECKLPRLITINDFQDLTKLSFSYIRKQDYCKKIK